MSTHLRTPSPILSHFGSEYSVGSIYWNYIEEFIKIQHSDHKIWNVSISAPYNHNNQEEGLIEVAYTDQKWQQKTYMFIHNSDRILDEEVYNIYYEKEGLIIFDEK